ncbi:TetR/AcrR family transcriptional regulator [Paractinoplanes rhizophilus]|jgi:AcrR family transcriptional regulator|uniref:TetR/AcrR family transcriptional regulator n=1 Tax=Paractinoplanes rhizophilus TaxID=1416877 RepID=A0ABW2HKD6_9ACTN
MTGPAAKGRVRKATPPTPTGRVLLGRQDRRRAVIEGARHAFARNGFAATVLDEVAAEAGISKVILYRHFDSKASLYQAVLDDVAERLTEAVRAPSGLGAGSLSALAAFAADDPDGFRLLFIHAAHEPEFQSYAVELSTEAIAISDDHLRDRIPDEGLRRWASRLMPALAIEVIESWLDSGRPGTPETAADAARTMLHTMTAVISKSAGPT